MGAMDFEWDSEKADGNLAMHGVSIHEAASVFGDPMAMTCFDQITPKTRTGS
jgi:uncharacterized DUF497 family protein